MTAPPKPDAPRFRRSNLMDAEAERAVLGACITSPECLPEVEQTLRPEDFAKPQHQHLWALLREMAAAGSYDLGEVINAIAERTAENYGGVAYVLQLPSACPSVEALPAYLRRLVELGVRREIAAHAHLAREQAYEEADLSAALLAVETSAGSMRRGKTAQQGFTAMGGVINERLDQIAEMAKNPQEVPGLPTGFTELDRMLRGLAKGDLVLLAARPAMGKTSLAVQVARNVAGTGVGVGIIELEMMRGQVAQRLLALESRVDHDRLRIAKLDPHEWRRLNDAADVLRPLPMHIDDTPGVTLARIRAQVRKLKAAHPTLGLVVLDYIQLGKGADRRGETREREVAELAGGLKVIAKEFGVAVVALSQLNRQCESREDKRPIPSDLRDSGSLEQDADVLLFLYRDEVYDPDTADKGIAEVIVAKQRSGRTGTVKLAWTGRLMRFDNLATDERFPEPPRTKSRDWTGEPDAEDLSS